MISEKVFNASKQCVSCITKPCQTGCPLHNDITSFIKFIKHKDYKSAFYSLCDTTVLMPICGRVCPSQNQCQSKCVKRISFTPVEIGFLESYVGDLALKYRWKFPAAEKETSLKVAVIGSGPAGLTCAQFLRRKGIQVTIFEKYDYLGGLLYHGIPDFRINKMLLRAWIDKIIASGIEVKLNMELGKNLNLETLEKEYDAIFVGIGANIPKKMNILGENLENVYYGNEILEKFSVPDCHGKTVIVNGGGNVAMDISRTMKRAGARRVIVVYRRSEKEMPALGKEVDDAMQDGVEFMFQTNIVEIVGKNKVEKLHCLKTELVQKEGETRLSPVNITGSDFYLDCDMIVMAIGSQPEKNVVENLNLKLDKNEKILVDENGRTSNEKVFAGGDIVDGKATISYAAKLGRDVANSIAKYLLSE